MHDRWRPHTPYRSRGSCPALKESARTPSGRRRSGLTATSETPATGRIGLRPDRVAAPLPSRRETPPQKGDWEFPPPNNRVSAESALGPSARPCPAAEVGTTVSPISSAPACWAKSPWWAIRIPLREANP